MAISPQPFDRARYRQNRARAATGHQTPRPHCDFLHARAMDDVVDRLETVTRSFPKALFLGADGFGDGLTPACGVGEILFGDLTSRRVAPATRTPDGSRRAIVCDDEALPFKDQSFDLIVSLLMLHHTNDMVGALVQMRRALKPDGLLVAVMFAENTLIEWKTALAQAEAERGGFTPRVSPFATIQDLGQAMQRAGLALPVIDVDRFTVAYQNPARFLTDLRGMGERGVRTDHGLGVRRDTLATALNSIMETGVSFELATLTGWAPHESQQKPLKPGSATSSLRDAVLNPRDDD